MLLRRLLRPILILVLLFAGLRLLQPYSVAKFRGPGASLQNATLVLAPLDGADLSKAKLQGANLSGAHLEAAKLAGANLRGANLTNANFDTADLTGADLRDAVLKRAVLFNADLRKAQLKGANLDFCLYNQKTRWPVGFNPKAHGAKPMSGVGPDDLAH